MEKGKTVHGKQGKSEVVIDKSIDDVSPENFDALFIPGDFPQIYFVQMNVLFALAKHLWMRKNLFLLFVTVQLLITAQTLEGRDVTGYKSIAVDLKNAGGNFHDKEVVVCQNQLVTSRQPEDIPVFIEESLRILG